MSDSKPGLAAYLATRVPAVALFAWVYGFFWLLEAKRYTAFLQPKLLPLLVAGLVIAIVFVYATLTRKVEAGGVRGAWIRSVILVLPLLFLWTVYGESLGTRALSRRTVGLGARQADLPDVTPRPGGDDKVRAVTLKDLEQHRDHLLGRRVSVEGLVSGGEDLPRGSFLLFRFLITCCAADAQPIGVLVFHESATTLVDDAWVRVVGRFEVRRFEGEMMPVLVAEMVEVLPTPPPEKRYLYA